MKWEKSMSIIGVVLLSSSLLFGCASNTNPEVPQATASQAPAATETPKQETSEKATRTIKDMAGRDVEIPASVEKIYGTNAIASMMVYTLNPDKLLGWNYELNKLEKKYILEKYQTLPVLGMGDNINAEAIIKTGVGVGINVVSINDKNKQETDKLQEKLGIPIVMVDTDLTASPEAYTFLADILGEQERGKTLSDYAKKVLDNTKKAQIPEDKRVKVYYGNGENSLNTAPKGTVSSEVLDLVQVENVANVEGAKGRVDVSLEQILTWNPEMILVNGEPKKDIAGSNAAKTILESPDFKSIAAVQSGKVYGIPKAPFSWIDRPMGPNRLIGLVWLGSLAYPEVYPYDLNQEVKEFYNVFYHVELTDQETAALTKGE
ncbi:MAG: ABC transporter substrate-binding protein [Cellulosilyticaceae bacterium]